MRCGMVDGSVVDEMPGAANQATAALSPSPAANENQQKCLGVISIKRRGSLAATAWRQRRQWQPVQATWR